MHEPEQDDAKSNPAADGVNVSPSAAATTKRITANTGKIHADFGIGGARSYD
jgi:hypothetical protein